MLEHLNDSDRLPAKVVVMGAGGFVGGKIVERLKADGADVEALTRKDVDLMADDAAETLARHLSPETALVVTSAKAPCKNTEMLLDNIKMMKAVCDAIQESPPSHLLYISSDAIYSDSMKPLTEDSPAGADNLHGIMHAAREAMLKASVGDVPLAFLRPTLIYGADDPHNGYGPNKFRRLAAEGADITLFGEGEEQRDHVSVEDVAELAARIVKRKSRGALNAATGVVTSFREIAEKIVELADGAISVKGSPRKGPMPHNGYRAFNASATKVAFPDFVYTPLQEGLARMQKLGG
jgi:nucleoside-diphosphate-sugar epimerase